MTVEEDFLKNALNALETYKGLADRAMEQVTDEQFFATLDVESNSMAVIVKHLAGNLRSRWTDFLNSDGEKPDRDRDAEFEVQRSASRRELQDAWEAGWALAFDVMKKLRPDDLTRTIYIRGEPHTVTKAIVRQLTHGSYHVGQIVFLAKHFASGSWRTLTIPRGKSRDVNAEMFAQRHDEQSAR